MHTRQLPCTLQKHMATRVKKEGCHLLIKHTRGSCHVRCENTWQLAAYVWERRRTCGRDGKCPHTSPCVCVQSGCGRTAERPHTSSFCVMKRLWGRPAERPHTRPVLRGTRNMPRFVRSRTDADPRVWARCKRPHVWALTFPFFIYM